MGSENGGLRMGSGNGVWEWGLGMGSSDETT